MPAALAFLLLSVPGVKSLPGCVIKSQLRHGSQSHSPDDELRLHHLVDLLSSGPLLTQQSAGNGQAGLQGS